MEILLDIPLDQALAMETLRDVTASDEEFRSEARALLGVEAP